MANKDPDIRRAHSDDPEVRARLTPPWMVQKQNPQWPPKTTPPPANKPGNTEPLPPPPKDQPVVPQPPPMPRNFPGARSDGAAGLSTFAEIFAPMHWAPLVNYFGTTVTYTPVASGTPVTLVGIWKEGAEAESRSPGRYSTFDVCDADIPGGPTGKDQIYEPTRGTFYVDRVFALAIGYSHLTLKETP